MGVAKNANASPRPVPPIERQPGCGDVDLVHAFSQPVLAQGEAVGAEGVRLEDIATHLQEGGVDLGDQVGTGDDQIIVTPFQPRPAEVFCGERIALDGRAHRAVEDEHVVTQAGEIG